MEHTEYGHTPDQIVGQSGVKLTGEQILMLQLSDNDIENSRLIPHDQLDQNDLEWLERK